MPATTRRTFLAGAAAAGTAAVAVGGPAPRAAAGAPSILKPLPADRFVDFGTNAEMRWDSVSPHAYRTQQSRLFVRNHTLTPTIDRDSWRLRVFGSGLVQPRSEAEAVSLSYADLRRLPASPAGCRRRTGRCRCTREPW